MSDNMPSIAFLGMGIMGAAMAANLASSGLASVKVWNRTPSRPGLKVAEAAGAQVSDSLERCLSGAAFIFTCLGDEKDVLTMAEQIASLAENCVVVDFSTIGPAAARQINGLPQLAGRDIAFLDAPVTGGDIGARNGTLTIMVGGERSAFDRVEPYLQTMGKKIVYCGPSGSGQALKLANQTLCALNLIGVCESMYMAEKLGLDPNMVVDVLEGGAGGSWALTNLGRRIGKGDLEPGFAIKHMLKDLRLVFENLPAGELPGTGLSMVLFERALAALAANGDGAFEELGTHAMIRAYTEKV